MEFLTFQMEREHFSFSQFITPDFGKRFTVYSQLYDFDDVKLRVGGELKLTDNVSLYGESMNVKGNKKDTYMGMRAKF